MTGYQCTNNSFFAACTKLGTVRKYNATTKQYEEVFDVKEYLHNKNQTINFDRYMVHNINNTIKFNINVLDQ